MNAEAVAGMMGGVMPYVLLAFLGAVLSVIAGILIATGRRVNPALGALGMAFAALGGAAVAQFALPADPGTVEGFKGIQTAAFVRACAWVGSWAVGGVTLLVLAAAGARKGPRDVKVAVAGGVTAMLAVIAGVVGGVMNPEVAALFFYVRAAGYFGFGLLVAAAMLSGGEPEHPGRDAGAVAGLVFAMTVACSEAASRGLTVYMLMVNLPGYDEAPRDEMVRGYMEFTGGDIPWLLATIVLAQIPAFVGLWSASRDGRPAAWAGLIWVLLVPAAVWLGGSPSLETLEAAALALP